MNNCTYIPILLDHSYVKKELSNGSSNEMHIIHEKKEPTNASNPCIVIQIPSVSSVQKEDINIVKDASGTCLIAQQIKCHQNSKSNEERSYMVFPINNLSTNEKTENKLVEKKCSLNSSKEKKMKQKIKTLQQKVRRQKKRINVMKNLLKTLIDRNFLSKDMVSMLQNEFKDISFVTEENEDLNEISDAD